MGDSQSKPEEVNKKEIQSSNGAIYQNDHYVLQKLEDISLRNKTSYSYFWVDPKIYNSQNAKYQRYLSKYFQLEGLSSVESLENKISQMEHSQFCKVICAASLDDQDYRSLSQNSRIKNIFLFCQNQQRAKLLKNNFPRISFAKFDIIQLKNSILQLQEQEVDSSPKTNLLVLVDDDANLLNQYRMNFHSLTCSHSKSKAMNDYFAFAKHLFVDQKLQINNFQEKYTKALNNAQRAKIMLNQSLKRGFFWQSIHTLPRITANPKKLAYLRFVFKELYEGIKQNYKMEVGEAYMVLTPSQDQLQKLKDVNNFLIFTSFVKAYTNESKAYQQFKKTPGSYFVRIILPLFHENNHMPKLDFGYYINHQSEEETNVLFNIYNFFLIEQFEPSLNEITLTYGSLADVAYKREHRRDIYRLNPQQQNLMRNFDYLQDLTKQINSQATVLQISGYFKQSLQVHEKMFQQIRKSQQNPQALDKQTIELGDAYKRDGKFKQAQSYYLKIKKGGKYFKALVHLADFYLCSRQTQKLQQVIKEIEKQMPNVSKDDRGQTFKARNYIGMQLMEKGRYSQASKLYKNLTKEISEYYDFRYQGIPLVHQIYTNRAACETNLNNLPEALSLLQTTISWQRICEGSKSENLQKTQRLFKSLHQSYRESQSQNKRLKKNKSIDIPESLIKTQQKPSNINQSDVNIVLQSKPTEIQKKPMGGKLPSLKQSQINILTTQANLQK